MRIYISGKLCNNFARKSGRKWIDCNEYLAEKVFLQLLCRKNIDLFSAHEHKGVKESDPFLELRFIAVSFTVDP